MRVTEINYRFSAAKIAAVCVFFLLLAGIVTATDYTYEIHPKPHKEYEIKDDKIFYRVGDSGLILQLVDPNQVAEFYEERGAHIGDPLQGLGDEAEGATIFLLTLINRTHGSLTFTPGYVLMKVGDNSSFAMDFTVLLPLLDNLDDKTRKIVQDSVFHSPEVIRPGTVVSKFLIYPGLPKKFDEFKISFDYVFFGGNKESKCDFYYQHVKVKNTETQKHGERK